MTNEHTCPRCGKTEVTSQHHCTKCGYGHEQESWPPPGFEKVPKKTVDRLRLLVYLSS